MTRAVLSPAAERDVVEIVEWIASENPVAARGFRAALDRLADTIGKHPMSGALKPQLASPPIRFFPLRGFPYVVVYTPERDPPLICPAVRSPIPARLGKSSNRRAGVHAVRPGRGGAHLEVPVHGERGEHPAFLRDVAEPAPADPVRRLAADAGIVTAVDGPAGSR